MPIITVLDGEKLFQIEVNVDSNLREVLLREALSPYTRLTQYANCGGRGICATCGVWVEEKESAPQHWHDKLAARFGYPRLSCQITVKDDMTIRLVDDKWVWGRRDKSRIWQGEDELEKGTS